MHRFVIVLIIIGVAYWFIQSGPAPRIARTSRSSFVSEPLLQGLKHPRTSDGSKPAETDKVLQELLVLMRQQMRILSNPEELLGREVISLLVSLVQDAEGTSARLMANERNVALALTARWSSLVAKFRRYLAEQAETNARDEVIKDLIRFATYVSEFQKIVQAHSQEKSLGDVLEKLRVSMSGPS